MTYRFRSLVLLLAACAILRGDFALSNWKLRRTILGDATGLAAIHLDRAVYAGSEANLSDLRLIRESRELPYVIETVTEAVLLERRNGAVIDQAVTKDGVELTYDLGKVAKHNRLRLETERQNFRQRVKVETSDDNKRWATAREDGAIFDFTQDGRHLASLDIDYPDSTRRYVRVTVFGWADPRAIRNCSVVQFERRSAAREVFAEAKPTLESKDKSTFATFDLGVAGLPVDRMELDIADKAFDRYAEVETSTDQKYWESAGSASLARYDGGESLVVHGGEHRDRYWRLRIYNGDDQPVNVRGAKFLGLERKLKFEAVGSGAMLYYGNKSASAPVYDLARRLANRDPRNDSVASLTLGPEQANPDYRPPPPPVIPWTERMPGLLYAVLGMVIAVLGFFAWRLLQSMSKGSA